MLKVAKAEVSAYASKLADAVAKIGDLETQLRRRIEIHEALMKKYGKLIVQEYNAVELFRKLRCMMEGAALLCPPVRGYDDPIISDDDLESPARSLSPASVGPDARDQAQMFLDSINRPSTAIYFAHDDSACPAPATPAQSTGSLHVTLDSNVEIIPGLYDYPSSADQPQPSSSGAQPTIGSIVRDVAESVLRD